MGLGGRYINYKQMKKIKLSSIIALAYLVIFPAFISAKKQYNSYKGLVMAGYQGWFNTPDDGAGRGWRHYGRDFKPGLCTIDMWPDVSEYSKTYETKFSFADGNMAKVFSSNDESTVLTHFSWMNKYGIDGVFMQRFVSEVKNKSGYNHFTKIFSSAVKGANKYDRAICVMYDLSGMKKGDADFILSDMDSINTKFDFFKRKKCPGYLFNSGKPLVCVWGIGFNDKRVYGLDDANELIDGLKKKGYSVMIGVPTRWRELKGDAVPDSTLHTIIKKCDILMPWFVGRYDENSYAGFSTILPKDIAWCKANKVDYAPLVYPGFSWKNLKGTDTKQIPRNGGSFYWKQIAGAINAGAEMLYVAMFDEMDEGTAIFKCATEVPVGESVFVPLEKELGNDYYLWLTGKAGVMLRENKTVSTQLPVRKK
jgi:hypothetical protein